MKTIGADFAFCNACATQHARFCTTLRRLILIYVGAVEKVSALVHSPPLEGWQAKPDGVVVVVPHQLIPLLWRGDV